MTDQTSNEPPKNNNSPNPQPIGPNPTNCSNLFLPSPLLRYFSEGQIRDFRQWQSERQDVQIPAPVVQPQENPFEYNVNMITQALLNTPEIKNLRDQIHFCYTQNKNILESLKEERKASRANDRMINELCGHLLRTQHEEQASRKRMAPEMATPHSLPKQPAQMPATPMLPFNYPMLNTQTITFPLQTQHNMFTGIPGIPLGWPLASTTNPVMGEHSGLTPVTSGMENSNEQQLRKRQLAGSVYQALLPIMKRSQSTPPS